MTGQAANGKIPAPFDLSAALTGQAAESEGAPFAFTYAGKSYEVPPGDEWPISALAAIGRGDLEGGLSTLLGEEVFARLCDDGLTVAGLNRLFEEIGDAAGIAGLPNSRPSPPRGSRPRSRR